MTGLIQGTVEYTTPRPFESASARVALSFAFTDTEDSNMQIKRVAAMAEAHAKAMVSGGPLQLANVPSGVISLEPGTVPGLPPPTPGGTVTVAVVNDALAQIGGTGLPGAEPSPTVAAAQPAVAAPAPSPASTVVQLPGASMTTALPPAETLATGLPGGSPATPALPITAATVSSAIVAPAPAAGQGISDTDLVTAITHRNAALLPVYGDGSAQKICDLVAEFVQPPAKAYAIPAAQRQTFLDRLANLA